MLNACRHGLVAIGIRLDVATQIDLVIEFEKIADLRDDGFLLGAPACRRVVRRCAALAIVKRETLIDQPDGIRRTGPLPPQMEYPLFDDAGRNESVDFTHGRRLPDQRRDCTADVAGGSECRSLDPGNGSCGRLESSAGFRQNASIQHAFGNRSRPSVLKRW